MTQQNNHHSSPLLSPLSSIRLNPFLRTASCSSFASSSSSSSSSSLSSSSTTPSALLLLSQHALSFPTQRGLLQNLASWFSPLRTAHSSAYPAGFENEITVPEDLAMESKLFPVAARAIKENHELLAPVQPGDHLHLAPEEHFPLTTPLQIPVKKLRKHSHIHGPHMPSQGQRFEEEEDEEAQNGARWWHSTASGVFGGICCVYAGQPFDTVKVRLQTQPRLGPGFTGPLDCLKKTIGREGFSALYKGSSAALTSVVLENAVLFTANSYAKDFIRYLSGPSNSDSDSDQELTLGQEALAGGLAGFFSSTAITPAEVIKCRLQVQQKGSLQPKYSGPLNAFSQIMKTEGVQGLFRGLPSVWMRDIPFNCVFLGSYEAFCYLAGWKLGKQRDQLGPAELFVCGGLAGVSGWSIVFPMDAVKSRIQTSGSSLKVSQAIVQTFKNEGLSGFYRGWSAAVLRAFPANAALLLGVEVSRKFFRSLDS